MGKMVNAFSDDALGTFDAVGVAEAIASGQLSAKEVTEAAIARAEKVNEELGAIAFKTYDAARERAAGRFSGELAGVPTFVKDNEMLKGAPTQFGTGAFRSKPAKKNSRFVDQFLSTGLNAIGKSTMPEFGFICSTENPNWGITRNPWNTDYTTGGSSSGSAAMVASGVVPIALANDGAGSTRIPASCCGLVGLKPTRNRLLHPEGVDPMPINIVYEGVLTRSVRDTAAFYAAAEQYYRHPSLPLLGHVQHPNKRKLKIAFFENLQPGQAGYQDADTYATILSTARLLESHGHTVEQLPFPFDIREMSTDFLNYYGLMAYVLTKFGGLFLGSRPDWKKLENFTTGLAGQFRRNALGITRSLKRLKVMGANFEKLYGQYDLIMTPVLSHTVPQIGYFSIDLSYEQIAARAVDFASFTGIQNITGSPAISLPMGMDSAGLPVGVHFCAAYGQDRLLLELAYELEAAKPWPLIYQQTDQLVSPR